MRGIGFFEHQLRTQQQLQPNGYLLFIYDVIISLNIGDRKQTAAGYYAMVPILQTVDRISSFPSVQSTSLRSLSRL
jgi:hypothetical protein